MQESLAGPNVAAFVPPAGVVDRGSTVAQFEEAPRISGALIHRNDRHWFKLSSEFVHTQLQRLPYVPTHIEPEGAKIHRSWNCFQVPTDEESFVRCEVLPKIM